MIPRKLKFFFAFFPYGGNGASASEHPAIRSWFARTLRDLSQDERVAAVEWWDFNDTPITMTRNAAVLNARKRGADVLVMVDSDQHPDYQVEIGDATAKPFISTSFDKLYEHWERGPLVIFAPYCGAPLAEENVFVFRWKNRISDNPDADWSLEPYTRFEAMQKVGFEEVGAGPTGLIMCDLRIFDILEPENENESPWFYYEWRDKYKAEKISTEDCTFTRDVGLIGSAKLGYNPLLCNWDAWAGHYKPKCVSKPKVHTADKIAKKHARAYAEAVNSSWRDLQVGAGEGPSIEVPPEVIRKFLQMGGQMPQDTFTVPVSGVGAGVFTPEQLGVAPAPAAPVAEVVEKYYHPLPEIEAWVAGLVRDKETWVVDFGGNRSHRFAKAKQTCGREGQKKVDFDSEPLPYKAGQVNFAYCRHTVEDLGNPAYFLKELRRVAKRGYIETPSPLAELTRGVCGAGVGYVHHRWIAWSENGVLNLIPKYPTLDSHDWFNFSEELKNPFAWNTYHPFDGKLQFKIWEHEKDFDIAKPEQYLAILNRACEWARGVASDMAAEWLDNNECAKTEPLNSLIKEFGEKHENPITAPLASGQINFLGCMTPPADLLVLQKLVRDQVGRVEEVAIHCADLGSWVGSSAIAMSQVDARVLVRCVDHFQGNQHDQLRNVAAKLTPEEIEKTLIENTVKCGVADRVLISRKEIVRCADEFSNEAFHLAYLDAEHDYQSVRRQIEAWMPKVKKNGILCGHDYSDNFPGVKQAVDELKNQGMVVRTEGNVWWTRVGHVCLGQAPQTFAGAR